MEGISRDDLTEIMNKYRQLGIVKGKELLLPPDQALRLADDLEGVGVAIMSLDGWYYVDRDRGWIVQDLKTDLSLDSDVYSGMQGVHRSVLAVKTFLNQLSRQVDFVSFTLNVPISWDLFPDHSPAE
jgi:hypothetical protein